MYTYNLFIYGHDLLQDEDLLDDISGFEFHFIRVIDGKKFEVSTRYHGGSKYEPMVLGTEITDTDNNPGFVNEVRMANETDYAENYAEFIRLFKSELESERGADSEYDSAVDRLLKFIDSTKPGFYLLEVSS